MSEERIEELAEKNEDEFESIEVKLQTDTIILIILTALIIALFIISFTSLVLASINQNQIFNLIKNKSNNSSTSSIIRTSTVTNKLGFYQEINY